MKSSNFKPNRRHNLTEGKVTSTLLRMAIPMLAGTFAMNAYNLTDTWFVSRLGTTELAAMSFTFPVVMILRFITMGLGTGALAIIAHAIGSNDRDNAKRLTTHALLLALLFSLLIMIVGQLSVSPLFAALGAEGQVLDEVISYMRIWFAGAIVMAVPAIMTQILTGTGDTRAASVSMMTGTLLNLVLDPLMIFGLGPVPAMGISGAALATVIAQIFSLLFPLYILTFRHNLIRWKIPQRKRLLRSWKSILRISVPTILGNLLNPLSMAVVTRIIAGYGAAAVAAIGATARLETFAFMIPMSIGVSLVPFVAQNYGAKAYPRILEAQRVTRHFALIYGLATTVAFFLLAPYMARLFSSDPQVIDVMIRAIRIICFGYGVTEAFRYSTFCLTGVQKPGLSALLSLLRTFVLLVPLSYLGSYLWGLDGVFAARLVTELVAATVAMFLSRNIILRMYRQHATHDA